MDYYYYSNLIFLFKYLKEDFNLEKQGIVRVNGISQSVVALLSKSMRFFLSLSLSFFVIVRCVDESRALIFF